MTTRVRLVDLIKRGECLAKTYDPRLDDKQGKGFQYMKENIVHGGLSVGVGPPGTGKTVVFTKCHADVLDKVDEEDVIIHIAPTNRLLEETAMRTSALLLKKGYSGRDLERIIRIYGSRFEPQRLDVGSDFKIIFTTGYQPGAIKRLLDYKRRVHLMIDEASRTSLHEVFISLSMAISEKLRRGRSVDILGSFNVIGDPMQAIVDPFGYRWKHEQLIVYRMVLTIIPEEERRSVIENPPLMFEIAEKHAASYNVKFFFLERTYRMPKPSELLVSIPFYNGKVEAIKTSEEAMRNVLSERGSISSFIRDKKYLQRIKNAIDEALETCVPVVYIRDQGEAYMPPRRPHELEEYDEFRTLLGAEAAAYIAFRTVVSNILVVSPYSEIVQQARLHINRVFKPYLGDRVNDISFATIHSALGSEADVIVAVMGKEYIGKEHETIYFRMPELVNVQLSRHNRMIIVIGNIENLSKNMGERGWHYVSTIKDVVKELEQRDSIVIEDIYN